MDTITIDNKTFVKYITHTQIQNIIKDIALRIEKDYINENGDLICLVMLNGAYVFAADLLREIHLNNIKVCFVKYCSYQGENSSGEVKKIIGLNQDITDKNVLIVEDIVDSGLTISRVKQELLPLEPKTLKVATLVFKPNNFKFQNQYSVDYIGKDISNEFIIGYGFDLNGYGRQLKDIYQATE